MRKQLTVVLLLLLSTLASAGQIRQLGMMEIPGNPGFEETAFANGHLIMTHPAADSVDIYDPGKRRLVAQISGMSAPKGIAVNERAGLLYVANSAARNIAVISTKNWKVQDTIPLDFAPDALALDADSTLLYVSQARGNLVAAIDTAAKKLAGRVQLGGRPARLLHDPARNVLLVTVEDQNEVLTLDPALNITKRFRLLASQPTGMALDTGARTLYVTVRYAVIALNAETGAEVSRVATPAGVSTLWFDGATRVLYAASNGGTLNVIRTDSGRLVNETELRTEVRGHTLAFDAARKLIYLPGGREGKSKLLILKRIEATPLDESAGEVAQR
jgi:DNA-binding beta-propeller fold protein YncE